MARAAVPAITPASRLLCDRDSLLRASAPVESILSAKSWCSRKCQAAPGFACAAGGIKIDAAMMPNAVLACRGRATTMQFGGFLSALAILCALTAPATAQAPTPSTTAFDGHYVGTATVTGGGHAGENCFPILHADMTITRGQVVIHTTKSDGATVTFGGSLNAAGEVSAYNCCKGLTCASLSGTIHDRGFEGRKVTRYWCYFNVRMAAARRCRSTVGTKAYLERCWTARAMGTPAIRVLLHLPLL
jgi:hypothetical protein